MTFFPLEQLIILPSFQAVSDERDRLLEQADNNVVLRPQLYTFNGLERKLAENWNPWFMPGEAESVILDQPAVISELGRDFILEGLINERSCGMLGSSDFKNSRLLNSDGVRNGILSFIDALRIEGVCSSEFKTIAAGLNDGFVKADLCEIYECYERVLSSRAITDKAGIRRIILKRLQAGYVPSFLEYTSHIVVKGFNRLTPFQVALIAGLAAIVKKIDVHFILPVWALDLEYDRHDDEAGNPFQESLYTIRKLEEAGAVSGTIELIITPPRSENESHSDTGFLQDLFRPEVIDASCQPSLFDAPQSGVQDLVILAAPGRYKEIEEAGRIIWRLIDRGVEASKIALTASNLSVYGELIEDVFRRFNLPLFFRRGAPLEIQAPARAVRALFRLASSHWDRDSVMDILASPYLAAPFETPWEKIDRISAEAGVTDDRSGGGWIENLNRLAVAEPEYSSEISDIVNGLTVLRKLINPLKRPDAVSGFIETIKAILDELKLESCVFSGKPKHVKRDAAAFNELYRCFDDLIKAAAAAGVGNKQFSPDDFQRWLMRAMKGRNIGVGESFGSGIRVVNPYDLHGLEVDYLFFVGLNEGEFPKPKLENILVDDKQIRQINKKSKKRLFTTSASDYRAQELLFYHAVASCRRKVWICYSRTDEKGRLKLASSLIDDVLRMKPDGFIKVRRFPDKSNPDYEDALTREEFWGKLAADVFCIRASDERRAAEKTFTSYINSDLDLTEWTAITERAEYEKRRKTNDCPGTNGFISPGVITPWLESLKRYNGKTLLSANLLQDYASCPFAFWADYILGLRVPVFPDDEMSPLDEGVLVHKILYEFMSQCSISTLLPLKGRREEMDLLIETIERVLDASEKNFAVGRNLLWRIKRKNIARTLTRWLEFERNRDDGMVPSHFEWGFGLRKREGGDDHARPPLQVKLSDGGELFFSGRVDRIDLSSRLARVLDYKNSSNRSKYNSLLKEGDLGVTSFQAPIYQVAVAEAFKRPAEAGWIVLKEPGSRQTCSPDTGQAVFNSSPEERRLMEEQGRPNFFNMLEKTWGRLVNGEFRPNDSSSKCEFCDYRTACRVAEITAQVSEK